MTPERTQRPRLAQPKPDVEGMTNHLADLGDLYIINQRRGSNYLLAIYFQLQQSITVGAFHGLA